MNNQGIPKALRVVLLCIAAFIVAVWLVGLAASDGKQSYEVVKDLFVPMVGPMIAVMIPLLVFVVLPNRQSRERFAMELCEQYYAEQMRLARNTAWQVLVTEQRKLPPMRRAEKLNHFLDYLTNQEVQRGIDSHEDELYQRATQVLDFFALVNESVGRGIADGGIVRSFLLYYYLWWRDEIMEPLRKTRRIVTNHPKFKPIWWEPLKHLDALGGPAAMPMPAPETMH
jgi:hypothetical protein